MTPTADALTSTRRSPEAVLDHIGPGANVVVGASNGEPMARDELTAQARRLGYL